MAKQATATSLSDTAKVDEERLQRAIAFIASKRCRDDVVILFDGRGRASRKVIEQFEERLESSGTHAYVESWIVYTIPRKSEDPRLPRKQSNFSHNNQEVIVCSLAARSQKRAASKIVIQRDEFNTCGEISTASKTYTGVPMHQYCELPRMSAETKAQCLGVAASGAVPNKRVQRDIEVHDHAYSHCEVKPLALWQRICEHHQVTHIVDFAAGSGALAIACAGAIEYQGIAANEAHRLWLDSTLDRCVMYLAGKDKEFSKKLGGDDAFMEKVAKYFGGTMLEARRLMERVEPTGANDIEDEDEDDEEDEDE